MKSSSPCATFCPRLCDTIAPGLTVTVPHQMLCRGLTFLKVCHVLYGRDLGQNLQLFQPVQFIFIWLSASFLYLETVFFKPRCFLFLSCFLLEHWIELSPSHAGSNDQHPTLIFHRFCQLPCSELIENYRRPAFIL